MENQVSSPMISDGMSEGDHRHDLAGHFETCLRSYDGAEFSINDLGRVNEVNERTEDNRTLQEMEESLQNPAAGEPDNDRTLRILLDSEVQKTKNSRRDPNLPVFHFAPGEGKVPIYDVKHLDAMSFAYLFPDGRNGFDENREGKFSFGDFSHVTLCNVVTRFRRADWIFFQQHRTELQVLKQAVSTQVRRTKRSKPDSDAALTAGDIMAMHARLKLGDRSIDNVLRQPVPFGSQRFTHLDQISYITTGIDFFYHET